VRIDVVTIFPDLVRAVLGHSIMKRAQEAGLVAIHAHDLRDFTTDKHRSVDDTPYGGGAGMVMRPAPLFDAVASLALSPDDPVIMLTPQGKVFDQALARELSGASRLALLCGHYEGFDERVRGHLATHEISIGDYVLTGGELPALVVIDAVVRLLPGVLGSDESAAADSHAEGLLEYPHYTRPLDYNGWRVPDVLLSGHHAEIAKWRRKEQFRRTRLRRPDLWTAFAPSKSDLKLLDELLIEESLVAPLSGDHPGPEAGQANEEKQQNASADSRD
jgi:tRNA (guanine37-N1)-methyltransferase